MQWDKDDPWLQGNQSRPEIVRNRPIVIDEHAHGDNGYDHPGGLYPPGKWPPELPSRKEVAASITDKAIQNVKEAE